MTIQELLERSGGVIEWTERYSPGDNSECVEHCQMNLDQLGCIRIEYQKDDGEWVEWNDCRLGHRSDGDMINAILAAHARALGVE